MKKTFTSYFPFLIKLLFCGLSLLACIKCIFFGMTIDEEYAITMAYRMLGRDSMFYTMWEPHQTSGFICAILIRIFTFFTKGSLDYLVIYLRIAGCLIHLAVCIYVYSGLKLKCSSLCAFLLSTLCFSILPKWILVPEFSNMLLWSCLCMMSCLIHIEHSSEFKMVHYIFSGVLTCIGVLAYPSFLLGFFAYIIAIRYACPQNAKKAICTYAATCVVLGVSYVIYFCSTLGFRAFLNGLLQMTIDGEHATPMIQKLTESGLALCKTLLFYVAIYILSKVLARIFHQKSNTIVFAILCILSISWQFFAWLGTSLYFNEPMHIFYHIFIATIMLCELHRKEIFLYVLPAMVATLSAGLLTNTGIQVISVFLLPAIIYGLSKLDISSQALSIITVFGLLFLFLFAKGWLLCETGGYKADMTYVKQKALTGPAKNIYCRYMDGYYYNNVQQLLDTYANENDNLLCIGGHTLWYLLADVDIANFSTISTPTYDERLLNYYALFPNKYPDVIIIENQTLQQTILDYFQLGDAIAESGGIYLYFCNKTPVLGGE